MCVSLRCGFLIPLMPEDGLDPALDSRVKRYRPDDGKSLDEHSPELGSPSKHEAIVNCRKNEGPEQDTKNASGAAGRAHAAKHDGGQGHHLPVAAEVDGDRPDARNVEEGGKPHERAAHGEREQHDPVCAQAVEYCRPWV